MDDDGTQRDALPYLPQWVYGPSPNTWAPDISQLVSVEFLLMGTLRLTRFVHRMMAAS